MTLSTQSPQGDVTADSFSTATLEEHSVWTGGFNTVGTAKPASITLDSSRVWRVTAASHLTALGGAVLQGNIQRPFTVTCGAGHSPSLGDLTCALVEHSDRTDTGMKGLGHRQDP